MTMEYEVCLDQRETLEVLEYRGLVGQVDLPDQPEYRELVDLLDQPDYRALVVQVDLLDPLGGQVQVDLPDYRV